MLNHALRTVVICTVVLVCSGCRWGHLSFRFDEDDYYYRHHHRRAPVVVYTHSDHICTYDCHDHYWDGIRYVVIQKRHHHGPDCGHHWNGKHWSVIKKSKGKAYGHLKKTPPRKHHHDDH